MIKGKKVTIFGGSGFIGKSVVQKLAKAGAVIRVAVRDPQRALFLKTMGDVGQITPLAVRLYDFKNVQRALRGSDIAINLIGVLYEKGRVLLRLFIIKERE